MIPPTYTYTLNDSQVIEWPFVSIPKFWIPWGQGGYFVHSPVVDAQQYVMKECLNEWLDKLILVLSSILGQCKWYCSLNANGRGQLGQ